MIDLQRHVPQTSTVFTALASLAVCWFIWSAGGWIVAGDFKQVILTGIAFAVICVAGMIISNWRSGVYLFLIWLLVEDMVRKYMGNNMGIYFAKDVMVGITYLAFLKTSRQNVSFLPPAVKYALGLFFLLGV